MAFVDIGGAVTELVITCKADLREEGEGIKKGDAINLSGDYKVSSDFRTRRVIFGQALADADKDGQAIPIKVRGVCVFKYNGLAPYVNGVRGVWGSDFGRVEAPPAGEGIGINLKIDVKECKVHVLL